ncbi:type IV pilus twitching motility protein PilT [Candidatus Saccharibacteria bacterium]|nr:type IV pilus twitching motility protein PilT [Candidatus Saccharibacteria bacterium]
MENGTGGPAPQTQPAQEVNIATLMEAAVTKNASDIHIQVNSPVIFRLDGILVPIGSVRLNLQQVEKLLHELMDEGQWARFTKDREIDFSFAFAEHARFRINAFMEKGLPAAALRLIPARIPNFAELGVPGVVESFADYPRGLVLVTGPTGSGKTTTLAALVEKINNERPTHIISIEDPIEYTYAPRRAVIAQREVHHDTFSYAAALRSALRQDPDVVLIGEMRDLETISSAITLAETGHLVLGTLHTNSAAQSIDRIIDVFPSGQQQMIRTQLANILMAICSQRLLPKLAGGRIAACEILIANNAVRGIIREGKSHQLDTVIQTGADQGMQTLDRTLAKLVKTGVISYDVARTATVDPNEFERSLQ